MRNLFLVLLFPFFALGLADIDKALFGSSLNYFSNPGFESGKAPWAASGGTFALTTSTGSVQFGKASVTWDSNGAAQTLITSQSINLDVRHNGLKGQSGLFSCFIKVPSGTATHNMRLFVGTTEYTQAITSDINGARTNVYFPITTTGGQTLNTIGFTSVAADEPQIIIDDCYLGLAPSISVAAISDWVEYTPVFTGFGTPTNVLFKWRKNGPDIEIDGKFTVGTSTGTEARVSLPNSLVSTSFAEGIRSAGKLVRNVTTGGNYQALIESSVGYLTVGLDTGGVSPLTKQLGSAAFASGNVVTVRATFPIQGWSASTSAAAANQTDYGWTAYTPTFTGFGTPTGVECFHSRSSENLSVQCKFVSGTVSAATAAVSLPNSLVIAASTKTPGIHAVGTGNRSGGAGIPIVLATPGASVFNFANAASAITTAAVTANNLIGTGETVSFFATIPIAGWEPNQRAPTLIGSVTSNSVGALRIEAAQVSSTGVVSNESAGDFINGNCAVVSTSVYNCTFDKVWSSTPNCWATIGNNVIATGSGLGIQPSEVSTTLVTVRTFTNGVGAAAHPFTLTCMGSR